MCEVDSYNDLTKSKQKKEDKRDKQGKELMKRGR